MSDDEPDVAAEWTCAICQDVLLAPVVTPCGHAFDERCLLSWTKDHGTCPVCRSEIPRAGYAVCGALRAAVERCAGDAVSRRRAFRAGAEDFVTLARSTAPETPRKLRAEALRTPRLVAERRESDGATGAIAARAAPRQRRAASASAPRDDGRRRRAGDVRLRAQAAAILDAAAPLSSDDVNGLHWNQDTERVESALAAAVAADDVPGEAPTVELLLQSGLCDLDVEDDDGDTPLLRAAALKRVGAVEALLAAQRCEPRQGVSGDGSTPLIRRASADGDWTTTATTTPPAPS
ncbi:hypothetical protein JL721_6299 [Aureococcus anophagefferens]|nr:hypothetical protein JL721_6299 [Aureococcus anophagefferens]